MKIFIPANKWQLYGKLVWQLISSGVFFLFAYPLIHFGFNNRVAFFILFAVLIFLPLAFINLVQLIYLPISLRIDDLNAITIAFPFRKARTISIKEIESFHATKISSRSTLYDGIIITLKSGKKILVSDFNLKNYLPVRQFLDHAPIQFLGEVTFSPISFYRNSI